MGSTGSTNAASDPAPTNDDSANDASANDASANDASANDASANDASANDASANDVSAPALACGPGTAKYVNAPTVFGTIHVGTAPLCLPNCGLGTEFSSESPGSCVASAPALSCGPGTFKAVNGDVPQCVPEQKLAACGPGTTMLDGYNVRGYDVKLGSPQCTPLCGKEPCSVYRKAGTGDCVGGDIPLPKSVMVEKSLAECEQMCNGLGDECKGFSYNGGYCKPKSNVCQKNDSQNGWIKYNKVTSNQSSASRQSKQKNAARGKSEMTTMERAMVGGI